MPRVFGVPRSQNALKPIGRGARCLLDGIDAGLIPGAFLLESHGILRLPRLAVPRRFMAAINDLLRQFRMFFDRLPCETSP